jgi:hypothetical protein
MPGQILRCARFARNVVQMSVNSVASAAMPTSLRLRRWRPRGRFGCIGDRVGWSHCASGPVCRGETSRLAKLPERAEFDGNRSDGGGGAWRPRPLIGVVECAHNFGVKIGHLQIVQPGCSRSFFHIATGTARDWPRLLWCVATGGHRGHCRLPGGVPDSLANFCDLKITHGAVAKPPMIRTLKPNVSGGLNVHYARGLILLFLAIVRTPGRQALKQAIHQFHATLKVLSKVCPYLVRNKPGRRFPAPHNHKRHVSSTSHFSAPSFPVKGNSCFAEKKRSLRRNHCISAGKISIAQLGPPRSAHGAYTGDKSLGTPMC